MILYKLFLLQIKFVILQDSHGPIVPVYFARICFTIPKLYAHQRETKIIIIKILDKSLKIWGEDEFSQMNFIFSLIAVFRVNKYQYYVH